MEAIKFKGHNVVFAKDQKEYTPLPAFHDPESGQVVTCYKLTFIERVKVLFTGRIWFTQLTFNEPLQPQRPSIESPLITK